MAYTRDFIRRVLKVQKDQKLSHRAKASLFQISTNAIKSAGHTLEYMSVYSPDLNPIERKRAQAKPIRRKKMCDPETLFRKYVS